jgi:hypothetical protein
LIKESLTGTTSQARVGKRKSRCGGNGSVIRTEFLIVGNWDLVDPPQGNSAVRAGHSRGTCGACLSRSPRRSPTTGRIVAEVAGRDGRRNGRQRTSTERIAIIDLRNLQKMGSVLLEMNLCAVHLDCKQISRGPRSRILGSSHTISKRHGRISYGFKELLQFIQNDIPLQTEEECLVRRIP